MYEIICITKVLKMILTICLNDMFYAIIWEKFNNYHVKGYAIFLFKETKI
jgi:hypothetical protein